MTNLKHAFQRFAKSKIFLLRTIILLASFIFLAPEKSRATHFRGGTLKWQQAGGNSIQFTMSTSWRRGFSWPSGGTWTGANPPVGATINIGTFSFGDASASVNVFATVNSVDVAGDVINTTWIVTKTYTAPGNYTVNGLNNCCRLSTLQGGNNDVNYNLQTIVNVGSPFNNPPVSSMSAIVNVPINSTSVNFSVPATDPDGDNVTFRISTAAESGLSATTPPGFSISSAGTLTMNTVGRTVGQLYAVQVMMEDRTPANVVKSKVPVDFIIRMVAASQPPVFAAPSPAQNTVFNVLPGNNVSFGIGANDPDADQSVTLSPVPVPLGSTMTPPLPTTGPVNGTVSSTFNWTPNSAQVGSYVINFVAADNLGVQAFRSIQINVLCALDVTATVTSTTCADISSGAADITVTNFSSAANLSYEWNGPGGFTASTEDISGVLPGAYSVKVVDIATGCQKVLPVLIPYTDNTAPVISCPGNILVSADAGVCGAVVNYTTPVGTDNCSGSTTIQTSGLAGGATFPVGTTTNSFLVTDASGNTASCSFTVTVTDNEAPSISCPGNMTVNNDPGLCGAVVNYTAPAGTDNCAGSATVQTAGLASGTTFPVGTTTNTFVVADASGNTNSCSFTITVTDNEAPAIISCTGDIGVNADPGICGAVVNYTAPVGTDNCPGSTTVQTAGLASGATFPVGTTTNVFEVTDASGNTNTCSFTVTVTDNEAPSISCPGNMTVNNDPGLCGAVVNYTAPAGTDNCAGSATVQTAGLASGTTFPVGTTTNTFVVADASGNTNSCSFTITVTDNEAPAIISCTGDIGVNADPGICGAVVNYTAPVGTDNCPGSTTVQTAGLASGATFPVGTTTNVFEVTDASGNTNTCSFTVTVTDNEAPSISCPGNMTVNNDPGLCGAVVNYTAPAGTDNCAGSATVQTAGLASGTTFPVGTTTNIISVMDAAGNTNFCSFTVTVNDNENPTIVCPADITVNNDAGFCYATIGLGTATTSDNCAVASTAHDGSGTYPVGATVVTWTVTDASGNTATCTQTVTVTDNEGPTITCPASVLVNTDNNQCNASNVALGPSTTSDNCGVAAVVNNAPTTYPIGNTTVTWTVTDIHGNTASYDQTVTVTDAQQPNAICQNVTIQLDASGNAGITAAQIDNGSDDACGVASVSIAPSSFTCANVGVNAVTLTVTDIHNNVSTCISTVTVEDHIAPAAICKNITVQLNASGAASITASQVNNGSNDVCGIASMTVAPSNFNCSNVGPNTVTLTVTDNNGNVATCTSTVTVEDHIAPVAACKNLTVLLSATGAATITAAQVNNGSSDACGIASLSLSKSSFNCSNLGINNVILTVTDVNGNTATCASTVTVLEDHFVQFTQCPSNIVKACQSNISGANVSWTAPVASSFGSCTPACFSNSTCPGLSVVRVSGAASGTKFAAGTHTIVYRATNGFGDTAYCSFTVTVRECPKNPCNAGSLTSLLGYINRVKFGDIDNTSGNNGGYENFTGFSTDETKGTSVPITLYPGFLANLLPEHWKVWIDWNWDGDFYDAGEMVFYQVSSNPVSGNINIPLTAVAGHPLVMRVSMSTILPQSPCGIMLNGEVEDYTIWLDGSSARMAQTAPEETSENLSIYRLYPNPLNMNSVSTVTCEFYVPQNGNVEVTIMDQTGKIVNRTNHAAATGLNIVKVQPGDLAAGLYFFEIKNDHSRKVEKLFIQ